MNIKINVWAGITIVSSENKISSGFCEYSVADSIYSVADSTYSVADSTYSVADSTYSVADST